MYRACWVKQGLKEQEERHVDYNTEQEEKDDEKET